MGEDYFKWHILCEDDKLPDEGEEVLCICSYICEDFGEYSAVENVIEICRYVDYTADDEDSCRIVENSDEWRVGKVHFENCKCFITRDGYVAFVFAWKRIKGITAEKWQDAYGEEED